MLSAIKKMKNECFIGAFQYFYYQKYKKYIPDKIIKDYFYFNNNGVSLKAVKSGLDKLGWKSKIYYAQKNEIPENKLFILMVQANYGLHYIVIKRIGNNFVCFDPAKGKIKNYKLDTEIILIDIEYTEPFEWKNNFPFKSNKKEFISLMGLNILEVSLIFAISFYFKYALFAVESKNIFILKEIVLIFAIIGLITLVVTYLKNIFINKRLWKKISDIYQYFFNYLLDQNSKLKCHFTKMHVFNALEQGVNFIQFNLISKTDFAHAIMLSIAAIIILVSEYKIVIIPVISLFVFSSILTVMFRDKTFKTNEKVRTNEISIANNFLQLFDNIETSSGFEKSSYEKIMSANLNRNISLNYKKGRFNNWVLLSFGFVSYIFNMIVSAYIFIWIIHKEISISSGIYLITIATMLYTNLVKIWGYIFNYKLEIDSYNKFIDFVVYFEENNNTISYDGKNEYTNKLEGIKGHFQLTGDNGSGKSTYLKIFCGLFSKTNPGKIYISSTTNVIKKPKDKSFDLINLKKYNLSQKEVSDGQRQIRNVLLALETNFEALVLDEAMSSVVLGVRNKIYKYILKTYRDKTILIVDHDVELKINQLNIVL